MKNIEILIFCGCIGLLGGCSKTTMVSGQITDKLTGLPISGVSVKFIATTVTKDNKYPTIDQDSSISDINGNYSVQVEGKNVFSTSLFCNKQGYANSAPLYPRNGVCKTIDIQMDSIDAYLKVVFNNETGILHSIYYEYYGEILYHITGDKLPHLVPANDSINEVIPVAGGEKIFIHWDTVSLGSYYDGRWRKDTIFCSHGDTTTLRLKI